MTIKDIIHGSLLPRADAEILLAHCLCSERTWIIAHPEYILQTGESMRWALLLERRRQFEPIAYIIGEQEFFGRPFFVDQRVLIPRPSTEKLVERTLCFLQDQKNATEEADEQIVIAARSIRLADHAVTTIVEVGTGSGCVAVTLALERPDLHIIATDISEDALDVARRNATHHGVSDHIDFRCGDGFSPAAKIDEPFILVSNPPYIPSSRTLMPDVVNHEPHVALFGGELGTDLLKQLYTQAQEHPSCMGIIVESEKNQISGIFENMLPFPRD